MVPTFKCKVKGKYATVNIGNKIKNETTPLSIE